MARSTAARAQDMCVLHLGLKGPYRDHAIERSSLDRRQCYVLDGLRKSFLGRSKTAVSGSPREQCHLWITAVGSQLISLKSSGLCSLRRQLALRGGSGTGSRGRAGGTAWQSSATR